MNNPDATLGYTFENTSVLEAALRRLPAAFSVSSFLLWSALLLTILESPDKLPKGTPPLEWPARGWGANVADELRATLLAAVKSLSKAWQLQQHESVYITLINNLRDPELSIVFDTVNQFALPSEPSRRREVTAELIHDLLKKVSGEPPKRTVPLMLAATIMRTLGHLVKPDIHSVREVPLDTSSVLPDLIQRWHETKELDITFRESADPLLALRAHLLLRIASKARKTTLHVQPPVGDLQKQVRPAPPADLVVAVAPSRPSAGDNAGDSELGFLEPVVAAIAPSGVAVVVVPATFLYRTADTPIRAALLNQDLLLSAYLVPQTYLRLYETNVALLVLATSKPDRLRHQVALIDRTRNELNGDMGVNLSELGEIINGHIMKLQDTDGVTWGRTVTRHEVEHADYSLSLATYNPAAFAHSTTLEYEIEALRAHSSRIRDLLSKADTQIESLLAIAGLRGDHADE